MFSQRICWHTRWGQIPSQRNLEFEEKFYLRGFTLNIYAGLLGGEVAEFIKEVQS